MPQPNLHRNPFLLMIDPDRVVAAMEKSERLSRLNRHVCRPLDRPLPLSGDVAVQGAALEADRFADEQASLDA